MALKCDNCGKGIMYGHNVSHAKNRTRKIFKPNLHRAKVAINGTSKIMKFCTKCLRMVKNAQKPEVKKEEQPLVLSSTQ
jgi:large subunit ribosomal protein L28